MASASSSSNPVINSMTQADYITYTHNINDIKVVQQCLTKNQHSIIGFIKNRFIKLDSNICSNICSLEPNISQTLFYDEKITELKKRITNINSVHHNINSEPEETRPDDCRPLAAEFYNNHLRTMTAWNSIFSARDDLQINLLPTAPIPIFSAETSLQIADKNALNRYYEFLNKYPKLRRFGDLNDYTKGAYQILYTLEEINEVQKLVFQKIYDKAKANGLSHLKAYEEASNFSRIGVVYEDQFLVCLRDAVISPSGAKHTYIRIFWKSDLNNIGGNGGAATLPIINEGGVLKIVLQLIFRFATGWEFEIARGGSKANETPAETAEREMTEETGCEGKVYRLGSMRPDSGILGSDVPVFLGIVTAEGATKHDKTEAIEGKYKFTMDEIKDGFKQGYVEIELKGKAMKVPLGDPFLTYALQLAQYNDLL